jgi:hypothetical protein
MGDKPRASPNHDKGGSHSLHAMAALSVLPQKSSVKPVRRASTEFPPPCAGPDHQPLSRRDQWLLVTAPTSG